MNKYICFSLWGDSSIYNYGAIENVLLAKDLYPDFKCIFYIGKNVLPKIVKLLHQQDNTIIIKRDDYDNKLSNMLWRYEKAFLETENSIFLFRDCDSRLSLREQQAVLEWLESDYQFHIMRDHPKGHFGRILGGMFGCRNNGLVPFNYLFQLFNNLHGEYYCDMNMLELIYSHIIEQTMVHASSFKYEKTCRDFQINQNMYIGEPIYTCPNADKLLHENKTRLFRKHIHTKISSSCNQSFKIRKHLEKGLYYFSVEQNSRHKHLCQLVIVGDKYPFKYQSIIPFYTVKTGGGPKMLLDNIYCKQTVEYNYYLHLDTDNYTLKIDYQDDQVNIFNIGTHKANQIIPMPSIDYPLLERLESSIILKNFASHFGGFFWCVNNVIDSWIISNMVNKKLYVEYDGGLYFSNVLSDPKEIRNTRSWWEYYFEPPSPIDVLPESKQPNHLQYFHGLWIRSPNTMRNFMNKHPNTNFIIDSPETLLRIKNRFIGMIGFERNKSNFIKENLKIKPRILSEHHQFLKINNLKVEK